MKRVADFVKTCIVGGFFGILRLSAPAASALNCFMQWGIGSKRLLTQQD